MFEKLIANQFGKYLQKYFQNLDEKTLRLGIFDGKLEIKDLQLKREALFELDLPIEVKKGCIGRISLQVPWTQMSNLPVVVTIEDVLLVAGPRDKVYDPQREKNDLRSSKKIHLQKVENQNSSLINEEATVTFFEKLTASMLQRIQVYVNNVHICYEDSVTNPDYPFVCGIALHSFTAETTSSKWKATELKPQATTVYKLVKIESLSIYWNTFCSATNLTNTDLDFDWKREMKQGLEEFTINGEEFDFVLKPVSPKAKLIVKRASEPREPKLLVDVVVNDASLQISQQQYLCMCALHESFLRMEVNSRFRKYHPGVSVRGNAKRWWHYAQTAVVQQLVRPYSWQKINEHRQTYRKYKSFYKTKLLQEHPEDVEEEMELLEDKLSVLNILLAREEARLEFAEENPERAVKYRSETPWWKWWSNISNDEEELQVDIISEKRSNLWSELTVEEKSQLYVAIGYDAAAKMHSKPKQYIEHKVDLTVAHCSISLCGNYGREVIMVTLHHLLTSIETRPAARAFHLSFRSESFLVEGVTLEQDLVPIITAEQPSGGLTTLYVFALDLDKNPLNEDGDFALALHTEQIEVVYNQHAVCELMAFFQSPSDDKYKSFDETFSVENVRKIVNVGRALVDHTFLTRKKWNFSCDLKSPYFVIPEFGNNQKGGNVLVLDLGRMVVKSDLQNREQVIEDGTRTELEERLYDRFSITLTEIQVLFADSGEEWRAARQGLESKCHLVPKISASISLANSIRSDYKQLPGRKLNVKLPSVKLNLSDRRIRQLAEFVQNLPRPKVETQIKRLDSCDGLKQQTTFEKIELSQVILEPEDDELQRIKRKVCLVKMSRSIREMHVADSVSPHSNISHPGSSSHYPNSENSGEDEEQEEWARNVDLPGFDDNVSPSNTISILLRFAIGEVVMQLARSSDYVDKPYLMLRVEKLCTDVAIMQFGPAIQASLGGIQLVDKLHTRPMGEYLELLKSTGSESSPEIINILYRKVRSDCPEFRKHFHNVEQSLVLSLSKVEMNFHRGAVLTLIKFMEYITERIVPKGQSLKTFPSVSDAATQLLSTDTADPPVPHGATKFSISARVEYIGLRLCDSDMDLLEFIISGLETDFVLKANDKMILRTYLTNFSIEDSSDLTLYPKILVMEDDKVFDFKYVRHSPHPHKQEDIDENDPPVKTDASVRVRVGRIRFTLLYKFLADLQRFLEPFVQPGTASKMAKSAETQIQEQISEMQHHGTRLSLSVDIHAPVLIIPQKSDSGNMLILRMGDLSVENFFKEVSVINGTAPKHAVDNILFRLCSVQMNRAILLQDGTMEELEAILEPMKLRLDLKRALSPFHRDILHYELQGGIETIKANLGQKDLGLIISAFKENMQEGQFVEKHPNSRSTSPVDINPSPLIADDTVGKTLQAFFKNSVDVYKKANVTFSLEGIQLILFNDELEQDTELGGSANRGLSKFELEEACLSAEMFSDDSVEMKCSLLALSLEDIREDSKLAVRKIFQSYTGDSKVKMGSISVNTWMPPMVDVSYKRNRNGDVEVNILVEKTRLNVSVPYVLALSKFLCESWPQEASSDGGIVNPGFAGEQSTQGKSLSDSVERRTRHPSSSDCTSGYHSSPSPAPEEVPKVICVGAKLKKPEIILLADPTSDHSRVLVMKADFILDYNSHMRQESLQISVVGMRIMSCIYGKRKQTAYMVMQPCDLELCAKSTEDSTEHEVAVGKVDLRLSTSTVHTLWKVTEELILSLKSEEERDHPKLERKQHADLPRDLWSPKQLPQHRFQNNPDKNRETTKLQSIAGRCKKATETFLMTAPNIQVACELEVGSRRIPVIIVGATVEAEARDWTNNVCVRGELTLKASYFNEKLSTWEPLLEEVLDADCGEYKPWKMNFLVSRLPAQPITCCKEDRSAVSDGPNEGRKSRRQRITSRSSTSDEDSDCERDMIVIKGQDVHSSRNITSGKSEDTGSLSGVGSDSDDEDDNGMMDKMSRCFQMLCSDSSPDESESEADEETNTDDEDNAEDEPDSVISHEGLTSPDSSKAVFLTTQETVDTVDEELESHLQATYAVIESRNRLEFTLTPNAIEVITQVCQCFVNQSQKSQPTSGSSEGADVILNNHIGSKSCVTIFQANQDDQTLDDGKQVVAISKHHCASTDILSPASTALLVDLSSSESDIDLEREEVDRFSVSSALTRADSTQIAEDAIAFSESADATLYQRKSQMRAIIDVEGFDELECYIPPKTGTNLRVLHPQLNDTRYHVAIERKILRTASSLTVRSPMQIQNKLSDEIEVYYKKKDLEKIGIDPPTPPKNPFEENILLATIPVDASYNVPLFIAYHCPLLLRPANLSYGTSGDAVWWQELLAAPTQSKLVRCYPPQGDNGSTPFSIKVLCCDGVSQRNSALSGRSIPNTVLNLLHPVMVRNKLPYTIEFQLEAQVERFKLEPGEERSLCTVDIVAGQMLTLELPNYLGALWSGKIQLNGDMEGHHIPMASEEEPRERGCRKLSLVAELGSKQNLQINICSPYWIVNKSGLPVQLKGKRSDSVYDTSWAHEEPILFRFKRRRPKNIKMRVYNSKWSSSFSLDTVGIWGVVECVDKERKKKFEFLLSVRQTGHPGTKMVVILPYFIVMNKTRNYLRFMEHNDKADLWVDIAPNQKIPFWPETTSKKMYIKLKESEVTSQAFPTDRCHNTVLRMYKGSAMQVNVHGGDGESPRMITFHPYTDGSVPVRVDNNCEDLVLKIHQKSMGQVVLLNPNQSVLYTWDDPNKERTLIWSNYPGSKVGFPAFINRDGHGKEQLSIHTVRQSDAAPSTKAGSLRSRTSHQSSSSDEDDSEIDVQESDWYVFSKKTRKDKVDVFWVSFLDGNQRVLLFTQDEGVATRAQQGMESPRTTMDLCVSLAGIGLSVVNDSCMEVAYMSITGSPAIWEYESSRKWSQFKLDEATYLEEMWRSEQNRTEPKDSIHVDFVKMQMLKPYFAQLRRRSQPGIWFHHRTSPQLSYTQLTVHRLQIDNQLRDAHFFTVLHPAPISWYRSERGVSQRPFIELAITKQYCPRTGITTIKSCQLLVQEVCVRLDKGFLYSLFDIFYTVLPPQDSTLIFKQDSEMATCSLESYIVQNEAQLWGNGIILENLHLSPLKATFSFSPRGTTYKDHAHPHTWKANLVDIFVSTVGSLATEMTNIPIMMTYFEVKNTRLPLPHLLENIMGQYRMQLLQQSYAVICGLDVLGNPYALVRDCTKGLGELFYEPSMVQNVIYTKVQLKAPPIAPGEHGAAVSAGVQHLLGLVVGGAAGSAALMTGSIGNLLASLSFDGDFKKHRRAKQQQKQSGIKGSLANSGRRFLSGVILGLSGVITDPISGARQDGAEGFFRGVGKGLMGLLTKPLGGTIDMISASLDGVRRAVEMGKVTMRVRQPRYVNPYVGVRPYCPEKAIGWYLLLQVDKGHYAGNDVYWAHAELKKDEPSEIALVTDRHIFLVQKKRFWGEWTTQMVIRVQDIITLPHINGNKLILKVRQDDRVSAFANDERFISSEDLNVIKRLRDKIEEVLMVNLMDHN